MPCPANSSKSELASIQPTLLTLTPGYKKNLHMYSNIPRKIRK